MTTSFLSLTSRVAFARYHKPDVSLSSTLCNTQARFSLFQGNSSRLLKQDYDS